MVVHSRDGLDEISDLRADARLRSARRRVATLRADAGGDRHRARIRLEAIAGGDAARERAHRARNPRRRQTARARRSSPRTPARRCTSPAPRATIRDGVAHGARSDRAAARRWRNCEELVAVTNEQLGALASRPQIAASCSLAHRGSAASRAHAAIAMTSSTTSRRRARASHDRRCARSAPRNRRLRVDRRAAPRRHQRHRRDQIGIAVGRNDRRRIRTSKRSPREYKHGGAAAISIVTEPEFFRGSRDWIARATTASFRC